MELGIQATLECLEQALATEQLQEPARSIPASHPDFQEDLKLQSPSYLDSSRTRVANGTLGARRTLKPKGKSISYFEV